MMRILFFLCIGVVLSGCTSYPKEQVRRQFGCEISDMGLWDTTKANNKPQLKTAYIHGDNKLLRVFQVCEEGKLVSAEMDYWERQDLKSGNLPEKKLNIFVLTDDFYVDGEYLLPGLYEYVGVYTYTTTQNARATIRQYKKLPINLE